MENQERYQIIKTWYEFPVQDEIKKDDEFLDRFKTWEQIRDEQYLC